MFQRKKEVCALNQSCCLKQIRNRQAVESNGLQCYTSLNKGQGAIKNIQQPFPLLPQFTALGQNVKVLTQGQRTQGEPRGFWVEEKELITVLF